MPHFRALQLDAMLHFTVPTLTILQLSHQQPRLTLAKHQQSYQAPARPEALGTICLTPPES